MVLFNFQFHFLFYELTWEIHNSVLAGVRLPIPICVPFGNEVIISLKIIANTGKIVV